MNFCVLDTDKQWNITMNNILTRFHETQYAVIHSEVKADSIGGLRASACRPCDVTTRARYVTNIAGTIRQNDVLVLFDTGPPSPLSPVPIRDD